MDNRTLNRNFGGQNRPQRQRSDYNEDELREEIKEELGDNYIENILNFTALKPEIFIKMNKNIETFIKVMTEREDISSTKMRKIYELIKTSDSLNRLLFRLPYLAYIAGKESKEKRKALNKIYLIFKDVIEMAKDDQKHVNNIKKFAEALVAYQKYYEKDKEGE